MKQKKIAIILSGCGVNDGAEISESVLTMLALDRAGAVYAFFAPDILQKKVVDHYHKKEMAEERNVLVEAARIARGEILPLTDFAAENFDGVIFPGGFGVATTFCSFAADGVDFTVDKEVERVICEAHGQHKPIGALCISPVLIAKVVKRATVTIGSDEGVAGAVAAMGATHKNTQEGGVVGDSANKIVTTPCYMLDSKLTGIFSGVENLIVELLKMA